jgi:hypothetical protein
MANTDINKTWTPYLEAGEQNEQELLKLLKLISINWQFDGPMGPDGIRVLTVLPAITPELSSKAHRFFPGFKR